MGTSGLTLTLVRHAHADWPNYTGRDFDRPLTPHGLLAARDAAREIRAHIEPPTLLLASPAVRTRQTAEIIAEALAVPATAVRYIDTLYNASVDTLDFEFRRHCSAGCTGVLLVGHNPGISAFARLLAGDQLPAPFLPAQWQVFKVLR